MSSCTEYVNKSRGNKKLLILEVLGNKCAICGYDKCSAALEAHHINPKDKKFTISNYAYKSYEDLREELKKCILLCANCHREVHNGMLDLSQFASSFSVEVDTEIIKSIEEKENKKTLCIQCGKPIGGRTQNQLCPECYHIHSRKVERPSREEFKQLIRNLPFTKIGELYGVTDASIRKWCDTYKLPRKKSDIKSYSDEEWSTL